MSELEATLWDVVILGAGPAGGLLASLLSSAGWRTLLVEKRLFPRTKVCGCCLNERGLQTLQRSGLGAIASLASHRAPTRLQLSARGVGRCSRVAVQLEGGGVISRSVLDAKLAQTAVANGAVFLNPCEGRVETRSESGASADCKEVRLRFQGTSRRVRARCVAVATGLTYSPFEVSRHRASYLGASTRLPEALLSPHEIRMGWSAAGYLGMVVLDDGSTNLAAALAPAFRRSCGGVGAAAQMIAREAGMLETEIDLEEVLGGAQWRGTPLLSCRAQTVACDRVFLLGDAAGFVEPLTGEGISWALDAAEALAAILLSERCLRRAERKWQQCSVARLDASRRRCRMITTVTRYPSVMFGGIKLLRSGLISRTLVSRYVFPRSGSRSSCNGGEHAV
ncbi:MAG: FAD-dependent monooxygenase [Bdellovibrionales bacterium]|nr:FAD-dependent monooxygenase [Bdellovibrionales bacterium]